MLFGKPGRHGAHQSGSKRPSRPREEERRDPLWEDEFSPAEEELPPVEEYDLPAEEYDLPAEDALPPEEEIPAEEELFPTEERPIEEEKPAREKAATGDERQRRALSRSMPFYASLLVLTLFAWILPLRPNYSALEKRELESFPAFAVSSLLSGDWFDGISLWFSDTFPLRENWVTLQSSFTSLYGDRSITFTGSLSQTVDVPQTTAQPTAAPTAQPSVTPAQQDAAAVPPETSATPAPTATPEPTPDPEDGVSFDTAQARTINSALYFGNAAYELYSLGEVSAKAYSETLSKGADRFADSCRLFSIICPNSGGIALAYDVYDQLYSMRQGEAIEYFYKDHSENLIPVLIYDNLRAHNQEYLYFRTDHHWTGLGAWYAYETYCQTAGLEAVGLENYATLVMEGFLGSYYQHNPNKTMQEDPDTVIAYVPPGNITCRSMSLNGLWTEHDAVVDMSGQGSEKLYLSFLQGDHYLTEITNNDIDDDSAVLIIKDSYGNPFSVYLSQNYHTVVAMDWHYDIPVKTLVEQYGIDDIIVLTELVQAQGNSMLRKLYGDLLVH